MSRREHLFEAIGLVDDRLVEEAADAWRTATPWKKWAALAACIVLALGLGASSMTLLFRGCGAADSGADSAATSDSATAGAASDSAADTDGNAAPPETGQEAATAEPGADSNNSSADFIDDGSLQASEAVEELNLARDDMPESFGGAFADGGRCVVYLTDLADEQAVLAASSRPELLDFAVCDFSLAYLERVCQAAQTLQETDARIAEVRVSIRDNRVAVRLTEPDEELLTALRDLDTQGGGEALLLETAQTASDGG